MLFPEPFGLQPHGKVSNNIQFLLPVLQDRTHHRKREVSTISEQKYVTQGLSVEWIHENENLDHRTFLERKITTTKTNFKRNQKKEKRRRGQTMIRLN